MGNLIMPKADATLEVLNATLKIYMKYSDSYVTNETFKDEIKKEMHYEDGTDEPFLLKKSEIARYFNLINYSFNDKRGKITQLGVDYFNSKTYEEKIELIISSIENNSFGRNNSATKSSDSDYDPPVVFLKALVFLAYITKNEYAYLLYNLNDLELEFDDIILKIIDSRLKQIDLQKIDISLENKYKDIKFATYLENINLIENISGKYKLTDTNFKLYKERILSIPIKNTEKNNTLIPSSICTEQIIEKDKFKEIPNTKNKYENKNMIFSFLKKLNIINITHTLSDNINFIIGQPNTGKSYNFEESNIFDAKYKNNEHYKYLKIPVSGGIGNEYKGLQSTDLAITYDPIKKELRFGEFLQILMSAIVNPNVPHVIFLDDFHNQDISSLLSEYTPLFKSQQKRNIRNIDSSHEIFNQTFSSTDEFIKIWNKFIKEHCLDIPKVPITNRISGESLYLVYPSNFYLLGAANFNQNSLNIFADWEDRAKIQYKQPIEDFLKTNIYQKIKDDDFFKCCLTLNNELKNILEENNIFDNEKYCFGMWKMFDYEQNLINNPKEQKELIKFFCGMIKNSLRFNNKNSLINTIGKDLFNVMQEDSWFSKNIVTINQDLEEKEFFKILHTYNIYEEDI
jgi:hypothetical protein